MIDEAAAAEAAAAADRWEPVVRAFVRREALPPDAAFDASGPLGGIPVALKDNISVAGRPMTAGSSWWSTTPTHDAPVWERLRAAGAVLVGQANMHEFAYGASTVNPRAQTTRNPWDVDRIAGGSSGGSAACVAVGAAALSLGTDTGGSVRIPAALCGVTGFKPTYGALSTTGVLPLGPSCDHVGLIARDAELMRTSWDVLTREGGSIRRPDDARTLTGLRVGVLARHLADADPDVAARVGDVAGLLREHGAVVDELVLPGEAEAVAAGATVVAFEAAQVHRAWLDDPRSAYGDAVRARLERGRAMSAQRYRRAVIELRRAGELIRHAQAPYDVVVGPTVPMTAPPIAMVEADDGSLQARLVANTYVFNVTGQPAVSLPCGTGATGLPVGVQLVAPLHADARLLDVAVLCERALDVRARPAVPVP